MLKQARQPTAQAPVNHAEQPGQGPHIGKDADDDGVAGHGVNVGEGRIDEAGIAFGEALAILAGDALLSIAMEQALSCTIGAAHIAHELAGATTEMISGQVLDTLGGFPKDFNPAQQLELIHRQKTGALIRAACRMGAFAAAANADTLDRLTRWGETMGLMFQVVDDILDQTQSSEHLGKSAGKDEAQGKMTYPKIYGLAWSRDHVKELLEQSEQLLKPLGALAQPLRVMAQALATRTK